jgi:hypothetical protein
MPIDDKDLELILELFPEVKTVEQEKLEKKLTLIKDQMKIQKEANDKLLEIRKEFEDLVKE